jgi:AraC-like DNA-binding protein/mannose-6-phosphate isomerase-like protein (cupin superfamily)
LVLATSSHWPLPRRNQKGDKEIKMKKIPVRHIAEIEKGHGPSGKFTIRDVAAMLTSGDLSQELHRHDFYFFLAVQTGEGTHEIDFTAHRISGNEIFFMRPGQVHQLSLKAGSTGYVMQFSAEFYHAGAQLPAQRLRKASNGLFLTPGAATASKVNAIMGQIAAEYRGKQEGYHDVIRANLDILFIELIRHATSHTGNPKSAEIYAQARLEEFLELLEIHVASVKKASQYAGLLNLSLYQLNAITRATMGKTASELIDAYIILEAKRYLLATPGQVKDIAYHLGYEDVSYFIRFFKKQTGYAPEAFRHNFS